MLVELFIVMTLGAAGTLYGVLAPAIAGMLGFVLGVLLNDPASNVVLLCIAGYCASFFSSGVMELGGRTADLQLILLGQDVQPKLTREQAVGYLRDRLLIFLLFVILPISPLKGRITGLAAAILTGGLALASTRRQAGPKLWLYLIIQWVVVRATTILMTRYITGEPAIGIIIATAIPSILFSEQAGPAPEPSGTHYTDPIRTGLAGILAWIIPGYSATGAASVFASGTECWLTSGLINSALEGWVIHTFLEGSTSGKTVLGDIITDVAMLADVSMPNLHIPVIIIVIASAAVAVVMPTMVTPLPTEPVLLIIPLLIEGLMLYGFSTFLFIIMGLVLYQIRQWLHVGREATLTSVVGLT